MPPTDPRVVAIRPVIQRAWYPHSKANKETLVKALIRWRAYLVWAVAIDQARETRRKHRLTPSIRSFRSSPRLVSGANKRVLTTPHTIAQYRASAESGQVRNRMSSSTLPPAARSSAH